MQSELTSVSPVDTLDSSGSHSAASLLHPAAGSSHSGWASWGGQGWTSEQTPANHSWHWTNCRPSTWVQNKVTTESSIECFITESLSCDHVSTIRNQIIVLISFDQKMSLITHKFSLVSPHWHFIWEYHIRIRVSGVYGVTDFKDSSRHSGFFTSSPSSFTPSSCRLLLPLRSNFLRWAGFDLRADASQSQLILDKLHHLSLKREKVMHLMLEH